ncbi:hypothetical protein EVAR_30723_1 [Eumeta japonica]|uniref:Uncharacterized protein n=1 Tax=Eumeta variegata TaxID=151549 RepID=A0A4C1V5U5_EUMVA|nr:hypothetical protein EVAR_30723_1 [Eumeta japonica]
MKSLFDNCIYASGTVRRQRADLPKIVKSKKKLKLKKVSINGESKDSKDGTKTDVGCPAVVKQYTKRMGGVDHFDHIKGCNMSIELHYLNSHLDQFKNNLGDLSEGQGEHFHQDIETMENRYQGRISGKDPYDGRIVRESHIVRES